MAGTYFTRLKDQTRTRLWINNPTVPEVKPALEHGAVCCTTNPTYGANLLRRDSEYAMGVIDQCLGVSLNDNVVADLVQQRYVARIIDLFKPLYEKTEGRWGYVSIQGDPYADVNAEHITDEGRRYAKELGPGFLAKIPVTEAGLAAMETLLGENIPVIATEIFSIAQMVAFCEMYRKVTTRTGTKPAAFITHITGIYDEYLKKECVDPLRISIDPAILAEAGLAVARKQYRIFTERKYDGIMLGGGARTTVHFTGCVGEAMHITINWSTAEEILATDPPVENQMNVETPETEIEELCAKLPDFAKAWEVDGLTVAEFKDFGPVQRFRRQFMNGWDELIGAIAKRRRG